MTRRVAALLGALLLAGSLTACGGESRAYRLSSSRSHALPSPLRGHCWPLPREVRFNFPYQVVGQHRSRDGSRWVLSLQWDELSAGEVTSRLAADLAAGGFTSAGSRDGWQVMSRPAYGDVGFRADPIPGLPEDAVVRGTLRLDLPSDTSRRRRRLLGCTGIPLTSPVPTPASVLGDDGR